MATSASSRRAPASKSKDGKLVLEFPEFDRETKNAIRFQEDLPKGKDRGDIGFIYVLKTALERSGIDPERGLLVTVEELPED